MPEKTVAIYARQSVDKKDSISIESQIDLCRAECGSLPIIVYQDKGFSGKNTSRPDFQKLIKAVENGSVSKVVCYRLDRISRSIVDFGSVWELLSKNNVEFVSVNEKFDTSTPVGRAMLYIIMVFAQLERETIAERIKDNYYQRVKRGTWPGGPPPYGFDLHKPKGSPCRLMPNDKCNIIPKIFERYAMDGESLGSVARWLSADGIPSAARSTWDTVSVHRLLRQPAYCKADISVYAYYELKGLILANDIECFDGAHGCIIVGKRDAAERKYTNMKEHLLAVSTHDGIVNPDLFLYCQHKLDKNKQVKNTGKGKYTWLSGLLKCGHCGYSLSVLNDAKVGKRYLKCSGKYNIHVCTARNSPNLDEVEAYVGVHLVERLSRLVPKSKNPQAIKNNYEDKNSLSAIDLKINNLIESLAQSGAAAAKYISAEIDKLEAQRRLLLEKMSSPSHFDLGSSLTVFQYSSSRTKTMLPAFDTLSFEQKKTLAARYIAAVNCTSTETSITWKT